jgi:hypothetical protein
MRYRHRDRANRAVPALAGIVLVGIDLALVIGGAGLGGARVALVVVLAFSAAIVAAAVPPPERLGWLALLGAYALFSLLPPDRMVPERLLCGIALLIGLLALLVWHSVRKRKALWSEGT